MADNTRWLHPQGKIRITKADGNLYMHDLDTNRVKVAQLDRLIDIRTDKGNTAAVIDTGHTITSTVMHGFQFKTQEARDKFIADVMEVLVGNALCVVFPSEQRAADVDPTPTRKMTHPVAMEECQLYLNQLVARWRNDHPGATSRMVTQDEAYTYSCQPTAELDVHNLLTYIFDVEDIIISRMRRSIDRPDGVAEAILFLEREMRSATTTP